MDAQGPVLWCSMLKHCLWRQSLYGHQFESQLTHFQPSSLLVPLGRLKDLDLEEAVSRPL